MDIIMIKNKLKLGFLAGCTCNLLHLLCHAQIHLKATIGLINQE